MTVFLRWLQVCLPFPCLFLRLRHCCRQVEIKDILTWTEAFTVFQMVLCTAHPHRWPNLSKYKLLIIQTARHFSSSAWLEYDLVFRKDAAASGLSDWSRMNLDLYNFHLRSPAMASPPPPRSSSSTASAPLPAASRDTSLVPPFCHSWNDGQCRWPFGRCKYRHRCSNCEGEHTQINCPFPNGTEWAVLPSEACVHSVNSFVASSGGQRDLRSSVKSSCSVTVPVSIPSVAVSVHSFSPLAPASQVSPLRLDQFQTELQHHPDQAAVAYVLSGLREGFRIGFESSMVNLKSASSNMRSSFEHPFVIDSYLQTEVSSGRVAGPFSAPPFPSLHISRFGVIPKNNQPGKWRLILDLSSPVGHSVNDGIPKPPFTVQYVSVDAVIEGIMARGRGTLMAKFDVASAYRNVAIHPDDRPLLGMQWRGKYFVDLVLPFGLRSAPFIFTSIADLVEWILVHNYGVDFLRHYLNDFFTLGPPSSPL